MPYASRVKRLVGQFIDGVIAVVPLVCAVILTSDASGAVSPIVWLTLAWLIAYNFLADGLPGGQSLGKKLLGMKVVTDTSQAPCSFGQSFLRNLILWLLGPLDWVFIFGDRHQRLGDKAAGTIVVNA